MKIKSDFVTNSSSTSFFFIFNGDKNDLFELIKKIINHSISATNTLITIMKQKLMKILLLNQSIM